MDDFKVLVSKRLQECLATPNWPGLPTNITSIEVREIANGLLQLKVYDYMPRYYTIKITANHF